MSEPIYLDFNATTPPAPEVIELMSTMQRDVCGNPSSRHAWGKRAADYVNQAREQVAKIVQANPGEILFTSGGSESNNTALYGLVRSQPAKKHIICSAVEHSSVREVCLQLQQEGYHLSVIPVDREGMVDPGMVAKEIGRDTAFVTCMWANNETGVLFPIAEIGAICREKGVPFHVDGVQAVGKVPIDINRATCDSLSLAAHKFYGPKGMGALFLRNGLKIHPLIRGGGQEQYRRAGTENVCGIVGMGKAAEISATQLNTEAPREHALRNYFEETLMQTMGAMRNGNRCHRVPNTTNLYLKGISAESLLMLLDQEDIYASTGSACVSTSGKVSAVLTAMGLTPAEARSCVRFSIGRQTTKEQLDRVIESIGALLPALRDN